MCLRHLYNALSGDESDAHGHDETIVIKVLYDLVNEGTSFKSVEGGGEGWGVE